MKMILLAALLLAGTAQAYEQTDYACQSKCLSQGNLFGLCKARCTYDSMPSFDSNKFEMPKSTDYSCQAKCIQGGMSYGLCKERCSY